MRFRAIYSQLSKPHLTISIPNGFYNTFAALAFRRYKIDSGAKIRTVTPKLLNS